MIGDKLLQEPKTAKECKEVLLDFKFSTWATSETDIINNAKRLVELNNEVYEKYQEYETTIYLRDNGTP